MSRTQSRFPRVRPWVTVLWVVNLWAGLPSEAVAEGVRDFGDGWLLNPRDAASVLVSGDTELQKRQGRDRGWGLWAGAGRGLLYSLNDLPLSLLEGGVHRRGKTWPWSVACSWECLGKELLVEETALVRVRLGMNPQFGVRVRGRRLRLAGEWIDADLETSLEGRLNFVLTHQVRGNVALWLHSDRPPSWHRLRGRRTLAEVKLFTPGSALAVRVDQRGDGTPILSLEMMGRLAWGLGLGFRVDPETGSLGGSLVAKVPGPWLRTSHLVHPALGVTHRYHLGVGEPAASAH